MDIFYIRKDDYVYRCRFVINDKIKLRHFQFQLTVDCGIPVKGTCKTHYKDKPCIDGIYTKWNVIDKEVKKTNAYTGSNGLKDEYKIEYEKLEPPYLSTLIDKLLDEDEKTIAEILNPNYEKEEKCFKKNTRKLKQHKIDELNLKLESVFPYYDKIWEFIDIKILDIFTVDDYDRASIIANDFINQNYMKLIDVSECNCKDKFAANSGEISSFQRTRKSNYHLKE